MNDRGRTKYRGALCNKVVDIPIQSRRGKRKKFIVWKASNDIWLKMSRKMDWEQNVVRRRSEIIILSNIRCIVYYLILIDWKKYDMNSVGTHLVTFF